MSPAPENPPTDWSEHPAVQIPATCNHRRRGKFCQPCYMRARNKLLRLMGLCIRCRCKSPTYRCRTCDQISNGKLPASARPIPQGPLGAGKARTCTFCGGTGHTRANCQQKRAFALAKARELR